MTRQPQRKTEPEFDSIIDAVVQAAETGAERPSQALIAELAYRLWMKRGSPHGSPDHDWLQAERILLDASAEALQPAPATQTTAQSLLLRAGTKVIA